MNTETHLLGKRESSKIQIRERLLDESLKLFSSRGLEKTTVADIVEQSGIARGTFYNYFPDVNSLFDAIISQMNGGLIWFLFLIQCKVELRCTLMVSPLRSIH